MHFYSAIEYTEINDCINQGIILEMVGVLNIVSCHVNQVGT